MKGLGEKNLIFFEMKKKMKFPDLGFHKVELSFLVYGGWFWKDGQTSESFYFSWNHFKGSSLEDFNTFDEFLLHRPWKTTLQ